MTEFLDPRDPRLLDPALWVEPEPPSVDWRDKWILEPSHFRTEFTVDVIAELPLGEIKKIVKEDAADSFRFLDEGRYGIAIEGLDPIEWRITEDRLSRLDRRIVVFHVRRPGIRVLGPGDRARAEKYLGLRQDNPLKIAARGFALKYGCG